jgi:hypothetical protein
LRWVMLTATMSMSDAEWLLLFEPASPSRVLLLTEPQSLWRLSLASRDGLVWRSPQWVQKSPKLKSRVRVARPSPQ